jgi:glucosamine kinase
VRLGIERAFAAVLDAARAATTRAGLAADAFERMYAVVGLAGIGRRTSAFEQLQARPHPFRAVAYVNDAMIACIGAHGGRDGGIVIVGTGSVGLALNGGREIRVGGYGFPVSDEGSGADLGLHAIRCALRACDGRIAPTDFTRAVMARFTDEPAEVVVWADNASATDYARFAPLVMDHAERGDPSAREIVTSAARDVDSLVRRLMSEGVARVALAGGVAARIGPWLAEDVRHVLVQSEGDALGGALLLARRLANKDHEPQRASRPLRDADVLLRGVS